MMLLLCVGWTLAVASLTGADNPAPKEYDIRLVDGPSDSEGRLEIFHDGQWGSFCDPAFMRSSPEVACRQLGFDPPTAEKLEMSKYGTGSGPVWLHGISCSPQQLNMEGCWHSDWGSTCPDYAILSLKCLGEKETPNDGDIRITEEDTPGEGQLNIYHDGQWGLLCYEKFSSQAATTACKQLGYSGGRKLFRVIEAAYTAPVWLEGVYCLGGEENLMDCEHSAWGEGVRCEGDADAMHIATYKAGVRCV